MSIKVHNSDWTGKVSYWSNFDSMSSLKRVTQQEGAQCRRLPGQSVAFACYAPCMRGYYKQGLLDPGYEFGHT